MGGEGGGGGRERFPVCLSSIALKMISMLPSVLNKSFTFIMSITFNLAFVEQTWIKHLCNCNNFI